MADPAESVTQPAGLWVVGDAWLRRAEQVITASCDALNAMNVFPVSDADTGSNLTLTLQGVAAAVPMLGPDRMDDLVHAAILSAHGNSGAIVAEMLTSVCRSLQSQPGGLHGLAAGEGMATLLRTVSDAATQAVARPVAGTILTVAAKAADAALLAAVERPGDALAVAHAARQGAEEALERTPEQLEMLSRAGVVDAGGQAFLLLVDCLVEVLGGPPARPLPAPPDGSGRPEDAISSGPDEWEVMYALRGATRESLDDLRDRLSELGHSVVVVGDESVAQVHVHLGSAGPAVEAALDRGVVSQIRITPLHRTASPACATRTVVSMVAGPGIAAAVETLGAVALCPGTAPVLLERLRQLVAQTEGDLIMLPNDLANLELVHHVAASAQAAGRRAAVIPTVVQVQGLAAIAVHEPSADFDAAVLAMSAAAGHTRSGTVTLADHLGGEGPDRTALRTEPATVLGLVEGELVEVGASVLEVAWCVVSRLLGDGGELLTLVAGQGFDDVVAAELTERVGSLGHGVAVEVIAGGQERPLLLVGLE